MLPPAQPGGPPLPSPTLSLPAEGATLAPGETVLRWAAPPRDGGLLELWLLDDAAPPREFFAALVEAEQEQRIALPAGRYAWRVAALSRQGRRYSMSPWSLFTVEKGAP